MSYTSMASANWLRLGQLLWSSLVESLAAASPKQADHNLVYTIFDPPKNYFILAAARSSLSSDTFS